MRIHRARGEFTSEFRINFIKMAVDWGGGGEGGVGWGVVRVFRWG